MNFQVIHVTRFSSIPYYSNVRLISKKELDYWTKLEVTWITLFNSCLKFSYEVVHKLNKGYPIFQTEAHEPYPELNGGQIIRHARGLSVQTVKYIFQVMENINQKSDCQVKSQFKLEHKIAFYTQLKLPPLPGFEPPTTTVWLYKADDIPMYHHAFVKVSESNFFVEMEVGGLDVRYSEKINERKNKK